MIPVSPQPEPPNFGATVREPGKTAWNRIKSAEDTAIANGTKPRKRKLPPHWRKCLDDMDKAYGKLCAYLAVAICPGTGAPTVDHMKPKDKYPEEAYEWVNYRLVSNRMNGRKGVATICDPFDVKDGWFVLDMSLLQVKAGANLDDETRVLVEHAIKTLKLNDAHCRSAREFFYHLYLRGMAEADFIAFSPFVAREFNRLGLKRDVLKGYALPKRTRLGRKEP